jgi:hypothetical protein
VFVLNSSAHVPQARWSRAYSPMTQQHWGMWVKISAPEFSGACSSNGSRWALGWPEQRETPTLQGEGLSWRIPFA